MAMTRHVRPYEHPARQLTEDSLAAGVCSVCMDPVAVGLDGRLRHTGREARAQLVTDAGNAEVINALTERICAALDQLQGDDVTNRDRARLAAETVWLAGAARTRRAAWRPPGRRRSTAA